MSAMGQRPLIVVVGGFLGAGKTSLILAAASRLEQRGVRCAVVLNDQGDELVDQSSVEQRGFESRAVTGGCFCCRFSRLLTAIEQLRAHAPEVIFSEPVGSCTDVAATVLGPLREEFALCRVAPFTVLVDPGRIAAWRAGTLGPNMDFLMRNQLKEADLVYTSKADLGCAGNADRDLSAVSIPGIKTRPLSARTGLGLEGWLAEVLTGSPAAGTRALEIDYAEYARAEAALAWLNLSFTFEPSCPCTPASVVGPLLEKLDTGLSSAGIQIAHLKLTGRSAAGWIKAAICSNGQQPEVEGDLDASPASRHELLVNLRAVGAPAEVGKLVEAAVGCLEGKALDLRLQCFSPAAPQPERRSVQPVAGR